MNDLERYTAFREVVQDTIDCLKVIPTRDEFEKELKELIKKHKLNYLLDNGTRVYAKNFETQSS